MTMSMEQIAKELENLGKIHEVLGTALHWLETQGHLKVMNLKERDDLVKAIKEVMPPDLLDAVEEGISNEIDSYRYDFDPDELLSINEEFITNRDPGDETD